MTMKDLILNSKIKYAILGVGLVISLPLLLKMNHDRKVLKVLRRLDKKL